MDGAELHAKQWCCGRRRAASLSCASATIMTRRACKWTRLVGARCTFTRFNLSVRQRMTVVCRWPQVLASVADQVKNFAVIYLVDISEVCTLETGCQGSLPLLLCPPNC